MAERKNTKVLFVNPMSGIEGFLPIGLSSLIAALRKNGFSMDIFDTTYYETTDYNDREKNERVGEFLPADMQRYGVIKGGGDYIKDLNEKVASFDPSLVLVTIPTAYNYPLARKLIDGLQGYKGIIAVGGKYPTFNPQKLIDIGNVGIVCVGEGERAVIELCLSIEQKKSYDNIQNLWVKKDGFVIKNDIGDLQDLDSLPFLDWDMFDKRHFYKPFRGNVYRYGHLELSRGCPHHCSYCANEKLQDLYKGKGKYFRKKSIPRAIEEIKHLKNKYSLEMIKFWDEEFFLYSEKELEQFAEQYEDIKLPFLITARLDTVTDRKAELLARMGCVNVSAGIESGSEYIRKNVLKRSMTNKQIIRGIGLLNKYGIRTSTLNMLGMPFETRKQVFETVELNRKARAQNSSVMILQPWEGTRIRQMAVEAGFMREECENYIYTDTFLTMPQLPPEEVRGLAKTFTLYRKVPKALYPLVRLCEREGKWRNRLFAFLHWVFKSN